MSASAGPSSESAFVSEPRDYWKDLRQISEFHEVWRLLDADYRNGLTGEAIRNIILAYSPQLVSLVSVLFFLPGGRFPRRFPIISESPGRRIDSDELLLYNFIRVYGRAYCIDFDRNCCFCLPNFLITRFSSRLA